MKNTQPGPGAFAGKSPHFGYDPFGNLLTQTVTKGSAPKMALVSPKAIGKP